MLSKLRDAVAPVKRALAEPLVRLRVPPDVVSLCGIPLSLAALWLVLAERPVAAFLVATAAALVDFVDGEVARRQERASPFGNMFEAVIDRFVEAALLAALAPRHPLASVSALGLSGMVSYVKARTGLVIVSDNRDWPGIGDRSDRVVLILLAILLSGCAPGTLGGMAAEGMLWIVVAICAVGCVQRILHARALIREAERSGGLLPYLR